MRDDQCNCVRVKLLMVVLCCVAHWLGCRCWAYAPPGGLVSPDVGSACSSFVTSVVVGRDMVPRLSFGAMHQLNNNMLEAAAYCKVDGGGIHCIMHRHMLPCQKSVLEHVIL